MQFIDPLKTLSTLRHSSTFIHCKVDHELTIGKKIQLSSIAFNFFVTKK